MEAMNHHEPFWSLGFYTLWHPLLLVLLIVLGWLYIRFAYIKEGRPSKLKLFLFISGLFFFYLAEGSPLKAFGHHYLFTAHMLTMSITYFIVPPLILKGLYPWMVAPIFKIPLLKKIFKFWTQPILAALTFNVLLSFYHIPLLFNWIMAHGWTMFVSNIILIFFSFMMWWLVFPPLLEHIKVLTDFQKLGYVFVTSVVLTPACAMIMFSDHFLYHQTANATTVFEFLPPLQDQKSGGVIMKILQELVFVCVLASVVYRWAKNERDPEQDDLNPKTTVDLIHQ